MLTTITEIFQATHLCYALFRMDRNTNPKMKMNESECLAAFNLCRECGAPESIRDYFKDRLNEYIESKS